MLYYVCFWLLQVFYNLQNSSGTRDRDMASIVLLQASLNDKLGLNHRKHTGFLNGLYKELPVATQLKHVFKFKCQ